ncbi:hypothetical protein BGLA2_1680012 [Burkholderia gladioli]|nr:hypothetical protein BGLA2_1680012 [Burkholderia gladioli]
MRHDVTEPSSGRDPRERRPVPKTEAASDARVLCRQRLRGECPRGGRRRGFSARTGFSRYAACRRLQTSGKQLNFPLGS